MFYVLSLTIIYTDETSSFICLSRFVLIDTPRCVYFIAFRLYVLHRYIQPRYIPFCLRWTATFEGVPFFLLLSSPYLPFDPLKTLLLFVFFQTSTLNNCAWRRSSRYLCLCGVTLRKYCLFISHAYVSVLLCLCHGSVVWSTLAPIADLRALSLSLFYLGIIRRSALYDVSPSLLAFRYSRLCGVFCLCCVLLF